MAVCDVEGPRPTPRRPARSRGAAFGEPGQQGLGGYEESPGPSAHRAAAEIPTGNSSRLGRSFKSQTREKWRLIHIPKAQINHIFFPSRRRFSGETPSPASRSSSKGCVAVGSKQPAQVVTARPDAAGFPPPAQRGEAHCPVLPKRGSAPNLGYRQRSAQHSQEESHCGQEGRQAHRAHGADGQIDRGSDHGAQEGNHPLAEPAGLSTEPSGCRWTGT